MRLANTSRILLPLALFAGLATCASAQEHPNVSPNAVRNQLSQPGAPSPSSASAPASAPSQSEVKMPKKPATAAPAQAAQKAPAAPSANPPVKNAAAPKAASTASAAGQKTPAAPTAQKTVAKPGEKPAAQTAAAKPGEKPALLAAVAKPAAEKPVVRRDPFDTLLTKARAGNAPPENLPPGKAGLIVDTLRIDGIVHGPSGMIAIVSNPQQRVYFLRDGDKLYDGSVQKISLDAIAFHETGKDAFGKPLERSVTKRLYPTSGEQQ